MSLRTVAGLGSLLLNLALSCHGSVTTVASGLIGPQGLAVDAVGNVFFTDGHQIKRVDALTRTVSSVAGSGLPGYSGDNGLAPAAQLNRPVGLALDSAGNLYVADSGNHRVRKIAAVTGIITTFAGNGTPGFSGDTGAATSANLNEPTRLAVAEFSGLQPQLVIADTGNNRIRSVSLTSGIISTLVGGSATANTDCTVSPVAGDSIRLTAPQGISASLPRRGSYFTLIVSDTGSNRLLSVDVFAASTLGYCFATASQPRGSASVDTDSGSREATVAETGANLIVQHRPTGFPEIWLGDGSPTFSDGGGYQNLARVNGPVDVAIQPGTGSVYFTDATGRIRVIDACSSRALIRTRTAQRTSVFEPCRTDRWDMQLNPGDTWYANIATSAATSCAGRICYEPWEVMDPEVRIVSPNLLSPVATSVPAGTSWETTGVADRAGTWTLEVGKGKLYGNGIYGLHLGIARADCTPYLDIDTTGPNPDGFLPAGGVSGSPYGTAIVVLAPGCSGEIGSTRPWLRFMGPSLQLSPGVNRIPVLLDLNPGPTREVIVTVGTAAFVLTQPPAYTPCPTRTVDSRFLQSPVPAEGGTVPVSGTWPGCSAAAFATASSWLLTGGSFLPSTLTALPNFSGSARTAHILLGGQEFAVTQLPLTTTRRERLVQLLYSGFLGRMPTQGEIGAQANTPTTAAQMVLAFLQSPEYDLSGKFVVGLYEALAGRDPSVAEYRYQLSALRSGAISHPGMVNTFFNAPEINGVPPGSGWVNKQDDVFVRTLYSNLFGRVPSQAEVDSQVAALANNPSRRPAFVLNLLHSLEFRLGTVRRNTFLLYCSLLMRDPIPAELQYHATHLTGPNALVALAENFANSPELSALLGPQ